MKKKGFTLAELLIVILIIATLAIVVMPNISKYIKLSKDEYNSSVKRQMLLSGKNYYSENTNLIPKENDTKVYDWIDVQKLASLKYTNKDFIDSENQSCMSESFVVSYNNGTGVKYYACMKCGDTSYINKNEKEICEAVLNIEDSSDESGNNNFNNNSLECDITQENTSYTDDGIKITVHAKNKDGFINSIKLYSNKYLNGKELISESEKNKNEYKKTIQLTEYGQYKIIAYDNFGRKKICGGSDIKYNKPTTIKLNAKMYYITTSQYNKYKNKELTTAEKTELKKIEYDGSWKNGYIYVDLDYYNNQINDLNVTTQEGTKNIKNKKYFFITTEGNKNNLIKGLDINGNIREIKLNTKLDRTKPIIKLTNSSGGKWTNKDIKITITTSDNGGSGVATKKYGKSQSNITSNVPANSIVTWKKANQKFTMYVIVTDRAGNKSNIATTLIKQDITAPVKKSGGSVSVGKTTAVKYSDNLSGVKTIRYRFSSSSKKPTINSNGWSTKKTGSSTTNVTYYVYSKGCDNANNCSINYLGSYRKVPKYKANDCKIRGDRIVTPGYRWKCTAGHWHTKAYNHYCTDNNGKLYSYNSNPSLVQFRWVCPTNPYGSERGWTIIDD